LIAKVHVAADGGADLADLHVMVDAMNGAGSKQKPRRSRPRQIVRVIEITQFEGARCA
jgi:hypothetical protein